MAGRNVWGTKRNRWGAPSSEGGSSVTVIDNLNSTDATAALSAKQGKVLNDGKFGKVECTYAVDEASQLSTKTHGDGLTCLCKGDGKIYTSDGTAWNGGVLGLLGVLYIAESETYVYDTNKFVLISTENAATLGGYQPSHYATASDLAAKADKMQRVTTIPTDGNFNPNCLYVLDMSGTATLVMGLNAAAAGLAAEYHIFFKIGTTAPNITWPSLKGWADGEAPTIAPSETAGYMHVYEVDFMEGYGYAKDWGEVQDA